MHEDDQFADLKENELQKAKITLKSSEKLINIKLIKFNDEVISKNNKNLLLNQSKQIDQIRLINLFSSVDLISSRDQIRKSVTSKNQYVTQRARKAYIATLSQSKISCDLSVAAQVIKFE
jgi:hypothetical protein